LANQPRTLLRRLWDALASLQLTIISLALLMALVVLCTLAQTQMGVFGAVQTYMRSVFVWWRIPALPFRIPVFPGGVLVGLVFLVNLTCALLKRLDLSWTTAGLWLVHAGLILLVAGEFATGAFQVETQMSIEVGQTVNYTESPRDVELAITNTTDPSHDQVYGIPASLLSRGGRVDIPGTPIVIQVKQYFANSSLAMRAANDPPSLATAGVGMNVKVAEQPPVASDNELNQASAFIEPIIKGQSFGTWLVSMGLGAPQSFLFDGQSYALSMRLRRDYLPYSVTLKEFRHDVYPGTDIPKNFSSLVHLSNPARGEERDVLIYMNQPLRYEGKTFYQASWGKEGQLSILQVVQNPGWRIPYISCALITLGLLFHFGLALLRSIRQRRAA
jgi:hypothetical protein